RSLRREVSPGARPRASRVRPSDAKLIPVPCALKREAELLGLVTQEPRKTMNIPGLLALTMALVFPNIIAPAQDAHASCSAHETTATHDHHAGVDERGDHVMGFSHDKTTHHFRLTKAGGVIEVSVNDATDVESRDAIRMHLGHITKKFAAGDFDAPML